MPVKQTKLQQDEGEQGFWSNRGRRRSILMVGWVLLAFREAGTARRLALFLNSKVISVNFSQLLALSSKVDGPRSPTFGVVIVHCHEDPIKTAWYDQIPPDWDINIYETCGEMVSPYSRPFKNAGSEECTAYFDYVQRNYSSLPDITVFLQTDTFRGYGNRPKLGGVNITAHSAFKTFAELVNITMTNMVDEGKPFLHYGWGFHGFESTWGLDFSEGAENSYVGDTLDDIWDIMGNAQDDNGNFVNPNHGFRGKSSGRPGAVFAVHRDRILANPKRIYQQLSDKIMSHDMEDARRACCGLEGSWHMLFGEPAVIPLNSTCDHLYEDVDTWSE